MRRFIALLLTVSAVLGLYASRDTPAAGASGATLTLYEDVNGEELP